MFARTDSHIEFGRAVCVRCTAVRNMEQCTHEPPSLFSVRFNHPMLVAENDWIKCTFDDSHIRLLARLLHSQTHVRYTIFQASSHRQTIPTTISNGNTRCTPFNFPLT